MKKLMWILLCLASLPGTAQEPVLLRTEIVTLALQDPVEGLFLWDGKKAVPFRAVPGGISLPVPYLGPANLVLRESAAAFLDNEAPPPPVAVAPLPLNADRVLGLAKKSEGHPLQLQVIPVPMDHFRNGDYRFLNYSSREVRIRLGDVSRTLASGHSEIISSPTLQAASQDVNIAVGSVTDGDMKVYASVWGHSPKRRTFIFLFDVETPDSPVIIRRVHDRGAPK